jgi:hypothetical protein
MRRVASLTQLLLSAGVLAAVSSAALALPSVTSRDAITPAQPVHKVCSGR